MALDDLLARLERQAGTAGTSPVPADVPAHPMQTLGGTAGTVGTAKNGKGPSEPTAPARPPYEPERIEHATTGSEPGEVVVPLPVLNADGTGAGKADAMPAARAASVGAAPGGESIADDGRGATGGQLSVSRSTRPPTDAGLGARSCRACRHRARPGLADPGYCARRADTPHAYGPGHPLHQLPEDGGADCEHFGAWQ